MNDIGLETSDGVFDRARLLDGSHHAPRGVEIPAEVLVASSQQVDGVSGAENVHLLLDVAVLPAGQPVEAMGDQDPHDMLQGSFTIMTDILGCGRRSRCDLT